MELGWCFCQESRSILDSLERKGTVRVSKILCRNRYIEEKRGIGRAAMEMHGRLRRDHARWGSGRVLVKTAESRRIKGWTGGDLHVSWHLRHGKNRGSKIEGKSVAEIVWRQCLQHGRIIRRSPLSGNDMLAMNGETPNVRTSHIRRR